MEVIRGYEENSVNLNCQASYRWDTTNLNYFRVDQASEGYGVSIDNEQRRRIDYGESWEAAHDDYPDDTGRTATQQYLGVTTSFANRVGPMRGNTLVDFGDDVSMLVTPPQHMHLSQASPTRIDIAMDFDTTTMLNTGTARRSWTINIEELIAAGSIVLFKRMNVSDYRARFTASILGYLVGLVTKPVNIVLEYRLRHAKPPSDQYDGFGVALSINISNHTVFQTINYISPVSIETRRYLALRDRDKEEADDFLHSLETSYEILPVD